MHTVSVSAFQKRPKKKQTRLNTLDKLAKALETEGIICSVKWGKVQIDNPQGDWKASQVLNDIMLSHGRVDGNTVNVTTAMRNWVKTKDPKQEVDVHVYSLVYDDGNYAGYRIRIKPVAVTTN